MHTFFFFDTWLYQTIFIGHFYQWCNIIFVIVWEICLGNVGRKNITRNTFFMLSLNYLFTHGFSLLSLMNFYYKIFQFIILKINSFPMNTFFVISVFGSCCHNLFIPRKFEYTYSEVKYSIHNMYYLHNFAHWRSIELIPSVNFMQKFISEYLVTTLW
jgi:hypothetical protein